MPVQSGGGTRVAAGGDRRAGGWRLGGWRHGGWRHGGWRLGSRLGSRLGRQISWHVSPAMVVAVACLLIALTWFGVHDATRSYHAEARARLHAELTNLALAVEEQFRVQLRAIDQTLRILQTAWQRAPDRFDLRSWQGDIPVLTDSTLHVVITDEHGVIRASTRPELVGRDVSGRRGFRQALRQAPGDHTMLIGDLIRGSVTGHWLLTFARRLVHPDGSFAGLVAGSYDAAALARGYGKLVLGPRSLVALIDARNGAVDALADPKPADPGGTVADSPLFAQITSHRQGFWDGVSPFDGIDRIHAFRRVADRNLAILVAVDRAEATRGQVAWDRMATGFGSGVTLLILVLALLLVRSHRAGREREQALAHDRQMLAEKTRQLEATLSGMSDGLMMVDADLRLLAWNDKFAAFTGVPSEILQVGLPAAEMLRAQAECGEFGPLDDDVETEVARRLEMMRSGQSHGVSERVRPCGQVLELRRSPLPGGGFVTLYSDVTTRHAAEQRVREAQKMAAIGRLTAGIAHDFNNLLASIMGNAELMERQAGHDPRQVRRLAIILQGAQRGADLVQQLLAFSRKQPLAPVAVDINNIVRGMSGLLRSTLGGAVRVETRLGARWPALVDPVQIEHVVLNLAINARDAMPEGGVLTIASEDVTVTEPRLMAGLASGEYVAVAVADTGTGMTPEVQRSALEPFFTTKPPGRGSGLGLSQVYGVASQSGGGVQIDSAVGRGTTVTVFLPRAPAGASGGHASGARPADALPRCRGTVLLVEDEADVRETIGGMLAAAGFAPMPAEDGTAALRLLEDGCAFDLLLTDLVMPGMNGVELAAAVRARRPGVPVVVVTGYNDDLRVSGERWVLTKPFVASRLVETLRAALRHAPETVT